MLHYYEHIFKATPYKGALRKLFSLYTQSDLDALEAEYLRKINNDNKGMTALKSIDVVEKRILYLIARIAKPSLCIETGVGYGLSSRSILQALEDNCKGRLFSIDPAPLRTKGFIPKDLERRWSFIQGKSREMLYPLLKQIGEVDLFFHDSDHSYGNMISEFGIMWPRIRKGGLLLSHDTYINGAFVDFCNSVWRTPIIFKTPWYLGAVMK